MEAVGYVAAKGVIAWNFPCTPAIGTQLYSQATVDTLRAQLEAAEAEVAKLSSANIAYSQQVNELIGRAGNAERGIIERDDDMVVPMALWEEMDRVGLEWKARAEAAEAECARIADELVQMRDSWVVPTAGKPSSRRIATINEAGTMRAEDDFDNEVWARRKCATDLDKIIHRIDAARTKEQQA